MGGEIAEMILSDPPYGMHLNTDFSNAIGSIGSIGRKQETRGNKYDKVIGDNDDFSPELINTFLKISSAKKCFYLVPITLPNFCRIKMMVHGFAGTKEKKVKPMRLGASLSLYGAKTNTNAAC